MLLLKVLSGASATEEAAVPLLHSVQLDDLGNFFMSWTPTEEDVTIEIQVKLFSNNEGTK